jgi:hypothetical protein
MQLVLLRRLAAVVLILFCASAALASPLTINFRFADPDSTAQATGAVTFESTLLQNPGFNDFLLPSPAVLALNVTVSGSASGNGNFVLGDFNEIYFDTNGATLDFSRQLVGQPTSGSPWGTPDSTGGDFNLFSGGQGARPAPTYLSRQPGPAGASGLAPDGVFFFTLGANSGSGEAMVLTGAVPNGAVGPPVAPTPLLGEWSLLALASLLGLGALVAIRRQV